MDGGGDAGARAGVVSRLRVGPSALVALLLFWLTASPEAQYLSARELGFHHVLHWLQFTAGLVLATGWGGRPFRGRPGWASAATALALGYVLVIHLPWPLDAAAVAPLLHAALHAGFFVAGAAAGAAWPDVREFARILLVILTMSLMTILSLAEISGAFLYAAYPPDQAAASGIVMLAGMGVFWIGLAFADFPARLASRRRPVASGATVLLLAALIAASYVVAANGTLQ